MTHLKVGDRAPAFTAYNQDNAKVSLADFLGKKLVIYFYPRDNTPSCTNQACNLRDHHRLFQQKGYTVIGISNDEVTKHRKFADKYQLPFDLIADENKTIVTDYGVYGEKLFMGRIIIGIIRTTFIVDEQGFITHIITKVKTKTHTEQILQLDEES